MSTQSDSTAIETAVDTELESLTLPAGTELIRVVSPEFQHLDEQTTRQIFWRTVNAGVEHIRSQEGKRINFVVPPLGSIVPTIAAIQQLRKPGWAHEHSPQILIAQHKKTDGHSKASIDGYQKPLEGGVDFFAMFEDILDTLKTYNLANKALALKSRGPLIGFAPVIKEEVTFHNAAKYELTDDLHQLNGNGALGLCNYAVMVEDEWILNSMGMNSCKFGLPLGGMSEEEILAKTAAHLGIDPGEISTEHVKQYETFLLDKEVRAWLRYDDQDREIIEHERLGYKQFVAEVDALERLSAIGLKGMPEDIHEYRNFLLEHSLVEGLDDTTSGAHQLYELFKLVRFNQMREQSINGDDVQAIRDFILQVLDGEIMVEFKQ